MLIAVDGPAGVGKSTAAKALSVELNINYLDSGALYRTITYHAFSNLFVSPVTQTHKITETFSDSLVTVDWIDGKQRVYLEGEDVTGKVRDNLITKNVRYVANSKECRKFVNNILRKTAEKYSLVIDGRDIGTAVFPNADYKFYLEASLETRAKRRAEELDIPFGSSAFTELMKDMESRDKTDMERSIDPLKAATDSVLIKTDGLTPEMVIKEMCAVINQKA